MRDGHLSFERNLEAAWFLNLLEQMSEREFRFCACASFVSEINRGSNGSDPPMQIFERFGRVRSSPCSTRCRAVGLVFLKKLASHRQFL